MVGGAVINDGHGVECRELLNWLRYAVTLQMDPTGTLTALPPGSSIGAIGAALPTLRVDAPLQNHWCTSVVFDMVLGPIHPLAQDLRLFCLNEWPLVEAALSTSVDDSTLVLPIILRWFQIETLAYFRSLSMGRTAHMPNFQEIMALIERRAYHLQPPLPQQYLVPATATRPASASTEGPSSVGHPPAAQSIASPDNQRVPGPRINNPGLVPEWGEAFNNSNKTIRALREFAPSTHDRDTQATAPICLSYHIRGNCY